MDSEFVISSKRKDANKNAVKILEAAKKIFSQKGLDATIEEVALEANVGVGTVYRRFNNKHQLANAVANEVISDIYNEQAVILQSNQPTVDKVYQIFNCYGQITQKYGEIHPMIVELLVTDKGDNEFKETFLSHLKQLYAEVIEHGQKEGVFRDGDPRLYEIFLHNMINPQMVNQFAAIMPLENVPYFLADLALNGVLKK
ncbi:TetR/AcrR family transcriptional regulator [Bacillus sp. EB600]|uniref:TetR/AcrR family transcriptional regulator n=1 Tax=Bacillus sp. EB600 TaxID=2806345 RepID=UPI002108B213|nr:TetR/AcrR family transcriptional regulator [Bacillus sp. EB600]MCQ6279277.1 TetR/AcrR family transcriptional regulator [Bacillus sp. EB600]